MTMNVQGQLEKADDEAKNQSERAASISQRTRAKQNNPVTGPLNEYWTHAAACTTHRNRYVSLLEDTKPDRRLLKLTKHVMAKMMIELTTLYTAVMAIEEVPAIIAQEQELKSSVEVADSHYYILFPRMLGAGTSITSSYTTSSLNSIASVGQSDRARILKGATELTQGATAEEEGINKELDNAMVEIEQAELDASVDLSTDVRDLAEAEKQLNEANKTFQQENERIQKQQDATKKQEEEVKRREEEARALIKKQVKQAAKAKREAEADRLAAEKLERQHEQDRRDREAKREEQKQRETEEMERRKREMIKTREALQAKVAQQQASVQQKKEQTAQTINEIDKKRQRARQLHQERRDAITRKHGQAFADLLNSFLGSQPSVPYPDEDSILSMMAAGEFDEIDNELRAETERRRTPEEITAQGKEMNLRMNAIFSAHNTKKEAKKRQEHTTYALTSNVLPKSSDDTNITPAQSILRPQATTFTPKNARLTASPIPLPNEHPSSIDPRSAAKNILRDSPPPLSVLELARKVKTERDQILQTRNPPEHSTTPNGEEASGPTIHHERGEERETASQTENMQTNEQRLQRMNSQLIHDATVQQQLYHQQLEMYKMKETLQRQTNDMEEMKRQRSVTGSTKQRPQESPVPPAQSVKDGQQEETTPKLAPIILSDNPDNNSAQASEDLSQTLLRQLTQAIAQNRLPVQQPTIYQGDPLKYPAWRASFALLIEGQSIPNEQKLFYLQQYVGGVAYDTIANFFLLGEATSFTRAMETLEKRFGHKLAISNAFREKLDSWPAIHSRDGKGLRALSDFLQQCVIAGQVVGQMGILDDAHYQNNIVSKLPEWAFYKWRGIVSRKTESKGEYPKFVELAKFVEIQANEANEPMLGQYTKAAHNTNNLKTDRPPNVKARQTYVVGNAENESQQDPRNDQGTSKYKGQNTQTRGNNPAQGNPNGQGNYSKKITYDSDPTAWKHVNLQKKVFRCLFHQSNTHTTDECSAMKLKTPTECYEMIRNSGICLGCANSFEHRKMSCTNIKTCTQCGRPHLTITHGRVFPPSQRPTVADGQSQQQSAQPV